MHVNLSCCWQSEALITHCSFMFWVCDAPVERGCVHNRPLYTIHYQRGVTACLALNSYTCKSTRQTCRTAEERMASRVPVNTGYLDGFQWTIAVWSVCNLNVGQQSWTPPLLTIRKYTPTDFLLTSLWSVNELDLIRFHSVAVVTVWKCEIIL